MRKSLVLSSHPLCGGCFGSPRGLTLHPLSQRPRSGLSLCAGDNHPSHSCSLDPVVTNQSAPQAPAFRTHPRAQGDAQVIDPSPARGPSPCPPFCSLWPSGAPPPYALLPASLSSRHDHCDLGRYGRWWSSGVGQQTPKTVVLARGGLHVCPALLWTASDWTVVRAAAVPPS